MEPEVVLGPTTGDKKSPRLLLLYADADRALAVGQRIPASDWELVIGPLTAVPYEWVRGLGVDLVMLSPPEHGDLLAICKQVRGAVELPIVVLSPRSDEPTIAGALGLGIDEYFAEPIGDRELAARLDALLRRVRRYGGPKELLRLGDIALSSVDHTVQRKGRKISLSPIEFRLFSCLASAPGTVFTHQTLMARVWGVEYVDSRHYLRLYVRYLREKLEDDPTSPRLIVSEWGIGYRFQPQEIASEPSPVLTR
jgi:two-component system KDP operon response regulator KdpE